VSQRHVTAGRCYRSRGGLQRVRRNQRDVHDRLVYAVAQLLIKRDVRRLSNMVALGPVVAIEADIAAAHHVREPVLPEQVGVGHRVRFVDADERRAGGAQHEHPEGLLLSKKVSL